MKNIVYYDCFIPLSVQIQVIFESLVQGGQVILFSQCFTVDAAFLPALFYNIITYNSQLICDFIICNNVKDGYLKLIFVSFKFLTSF